MNAAAGRAVYQRAGPRAPFESVRCWLGTLKTPTREEGVLEPIRVWIEDFIRRWRSQYEGNRVFRVLAVAVVLAACAVTSASLQQAPTYEASAQVWVDVSSPAQGTGNGKIQLIPLAPTPETLRALTQTMIHAIDSRPVAHEAIQRLGLQMEPAEILDNLTIEQVESTSFIVLTYEDTDPVRAQRIVNTVGKVSSELISERSAAGSTLTANVFEEAMVPESPVSPHPLRNGLLTLVIGLVLCAGTVVVRPSVGAKVAGTLDERPTRQGVGIVERVKEKKLLLALGRRGKLTAVEAALESELSVEEANRILQELAFAGQLEVTVEHGKLLYSFWERDAS
jgi:capsular polysaccharide biosynthesis protein